LPHVQTLETVGTAELIERTGDARRGLATLLVPPVSAVEVAITALRLWQTRTSASLVAAEVVGLTFTICCAKIKRFQLKNVKFGIENCNKTGAEI